MSGIEEITTSRLKLIGLTEDHIDDLFSIYSDEEAMKYWDEFPHPDKAHTKEILQLHLGRIEKGSGICWGIVQKENPQEIIGTMSFNRYEKDGLAIIGYILSRKYWNQGIMSEVLCAAVEFGFSKLLVHRIEAHVEPGNIASEKLLQKTGFEREGLLRERHFYKEKYQNLIIYGLLKTDQRNTLL